MSLPLDIARSHLETLIERLTRSDKAVPDKQGDYLVVTEHAQFFARVDGPEQPVIRLYSVMAKNIDKTPELLEALNSINSHLTFLRTMWIEQQVLMEADLLAMSSDIGDFADACRRVALTSDHFSGRTSSSPSAVSRCSSRAKRPGTPPSRRTTSATSDTTATSAASGSSGGFAPAEFVSQRFQVGKRHEILGTIRRPLGVDDVVKRSDAHRQAVGNNLVGGVRLPTRIPSSASGRREREVQIAKVGDEIEHVGHVGEKRPVNLCRHRVTFDSNASVHAGERTAEPIKVRRCPVRDDVQITSRYRRPTQNGRKSTQHYVVDPLFVQHAEHGERVEDHDTGAAGATPAHC